MLPADDHVHSEWSYDTFGRTSMVAACQRAAELGLPSIAFTEHLDFADYGEGDAIAGTGITPGWWDAMRPLDVAGYLASIEECRHRFPSLRILTGVEAGEPHLFAGSVRAVLAAATFDRVLGSLHALAWDGRMVNSSRLLKLLSPAEAMRRYLTEVVKVIEGSDVFGILAHLDYPRRQWPDSAGPFTESDFEEEYRAVLRALAGSGRVLEINTFSPLFSVTLLRWWRQEGGTAVSFGSDAHVADRVADKFREAVAVAEAAGFGRGRDPTGFWRCLPGRPPGVGWPAGQGGLPRAAGSEQETAAHRNSCGDCTSAEDVSGPTQITRDGGSSAAVIDWRHAGRG